MAVNNYLNQMFSLENKVALITGGTGVLGGAMALGLGQAGAQVAVMGRRREQAEAMVKQIEALGGQAMAAPGDVMVRDDLLRVRDEVLGRWGTIDILVNAAGGTTAEATVAVDKTIFDMPLEPMQHVINLNLIGTVLPSQIIGEVLAKRGTGCIINISSMNAQRALTRAVAYAAGKAAVENFTRWLSVELALKFGPGLRVNAITPGFFVGDQNRRLLLNDDDTLTARGQKIIDHTPAGRFGKADELVGALIWLCSPSASFVNGAVVIVDGGANAFSGI